MTSPQVVTQSAHYRQQVQSNADKKMINLVNSDPRLQLDLAYARSDNFTGQQLYPYPAAFLRAPAAAALKRVQDQLEREGLGLKIWDAYRPYSVTQKMFQLIQDDRYVADPVLGSKHNRGCAVDLTLIDLSSGEELEMPTDYTDFSSRAWHSSNEHTATALTHRQKLRSAMEAHGFSAYNEEWWHYNYRDWESYELLDLSFGELAEVEADLDL